MRGLQTNSIFLLTLALAFFATTAAHAVWIDEKLLVLKTQPLQTKRVLILFKQGGETAPQKYNAKSVLKFLRSNHRKSFIQDVLKTRAQNVRYHWINHSITAEVDLESLQAIAALPSVHKVYEGPTVELDQTDLSQTEFPIGYHFNQTRLTELAEAHPDITGKGVHIGVIDSGVRGDHPSLTNRIARFYNPTTGLEESPKDFGNGHGTHVSGILVGDRIGTELDASFDAGNANADRAAIGFAPGAKIEMVAGTRGADHSLILRSLEYLLDPDSNPDTQDGPRIINNSWGIRSAVDVEPFYRALDALEYAGVNVVFSAGNTGHQKQGLTAPKEHPSTITVGAVDSDNKRYWRSSFGPVQYRGKTLQKPELVAPGVDILSSDKRVLYQARSGTSMAAPQVSATIAMMLQASPNLTPDQVRGLLLSTTQNISSSNWHPNFGFGLLDTFEAVRAALQSKVTPLKLLPRFLSPPVTQLRIRWQDYETAEGHFETSVYSPIQPKGFVPAAELFR